jgi:hypothetical protein
MAKAILVDYWPIRVMKLTQHKNNPKKVAFWNSVGSLIWWARQFEYDLSHIDIKLLSKSDFKDDSIIDDLILHLSQVKK